MEKKEVERCVKRKCFVEGYIEKRDVERNEKKTPENQQQLVCCHQN